MKQTRDTRKALAVFRRHGGVMSTSEALAAGVHPAALYGLLQEGRLERLARGLYRSAGAREFSNPDLAVVARKSPDAVVCLESALAFHGITTQIPRRVHVAVPRGNYSGLRLRTPPVTVHRFAAEHFDAGIETHSIDGTTVRVYSVARTLVDARDAEAAHVEGFRYRNRIGLEVAVEALRFARARKKLSNREILRTAELLRQAKVMGPYLEAVQ